MVSHVSVKIAILALAVSLASARDPSPLQDFCIAVPKSSPQNIAMYVNGMFCKDPKLAKAEDFYYPGLNKPKQPFVKFGSATTTITPSEIPGLNTLGISFARYDYAPKGGLKPPHLHPRASQVLYVQTGKIFAGFITSSSDHKLYAKTLIAGDVFVFPQALIHFSINVGKMPAVALSGLSSQSPGVTHIADAVFGSHPQIASVILAKSFMLDKLTVDGLLMKFKKDPSGLASS